MGATTACLNKSSLDLFWRRARPTPVTTARPTRAAAAAGPPYAPCTRTPHVVVTHCAPRACARPPARPSSRSSPPTQKKQRTVAGPQRQNGTMNRRVTPRQAANWVEEGFGAPFFGIPRLVPPITFRKRLRGALSRSRARGRRAHTRQHAPPTPALQRRRHAQAPAEDDPQRSHTGSGAHAPAASCPRGAAGPASPAAKRR